MASESKSSQDTAAAPLLCANGCGFFGNPSTNNLCSKCQRESLMWSSEEIHTTEESHQEVESGGGVLPGAALQGDADVAGGGASDDDPAAAKPNRCRRCNKKAGAASGFKCRCGMTFCGRHRYPEEHECTFDFKKHGRDIIAKANPLLKGDKLDKKER